VVLWNLAGPRSTVFSGQKSTGNYGISVAFTPEGRLVSTSAEGVRLWPSFSGTAEEGRVLWSERNGPLWPDYLTVESHGRFAVVVERIGARVIVLPLDGSPPAVHTLAQAPNQGTTVIGVMSLDHPGGQVAVGAFVPGHPDGGSLRILDLSTGAERTLDAPPTSDGECKERLAAFGAVEGPLWLADGRLVSDGYTGLRVWDLSTGSSRWLRPCRAATSESMAIRATPDSRMVVSLHGVVGAGKASDLSVFDLEAGTFREVTSHGKRLASFTLDPTGRALVTGGAEGLVRVGPLSGEEPHLLYGHTRTVRGLAVSPDGDWIASASDDETIRLWPMPKGRPLHTLPYEELLTKLRSLTNLRVVRDPGAATGYKLEPGPFPGWANVPEW
jgi:WD40 repeat protein